jgi:hypothetical protein
VEPLVEGVDPKLLEPPINLLRVGLELAPRIVNVSHAVALIRERLERQVALTGDDDLAAFLKEIAAFPVPEPEAGGGEVLGPIVWRVPDGRELSFFGMFATFDTPFEVTTSELAMELLFPADRATAEFLERRRT